VLGREPAAQDVVGVREHLDAGAVQVGMQVAGRQEDRLARLEHQPVEQQGGQHPTVTRVPLAQLEHGAALELELAVCLDMCDAGVQQIRQQRVDRRLRQRDPGGEQRPQALPVGLAGEQVDVSGQRRRLDRAQQLDGPGRLAEAGKRVELGERADQLRFGRRVRVVAVARLPRDAGPLLARVARRGLLGRRVCLHRQRLVGGEHLEQER
jgi:hypothetical protein